MGEPAHEVGLEKGDRVLKLDDRFIKNREDVLSVLQDFENKNVPILIQRKGTEIALEVPIGEKKMLGVIFGFNLIKVSFFEATTLSLGKIKMICSEILNLLLSIRQEKQNLGSVLTIGQVAKDTISVSYLAFIGFIAVFSVNLGFINLMPIPILDGGHILMALLEIVFGKRLNRKIYQIIFFIGLILLLILMITAIGNDLYRFGFIGYSK